MRTLDVYLGDDLIGRIVENRKGGRFEYGADVVARLAGRPVLSLSFPVKARPFGEEKTSNWFNGLLPEGNRRDEVCRSLGVSVYDWIGLLAEIGWECAGAVRVFDRDGAQRRMSEYKQISNAELAERLSTISQQIPQPDSSLFRMSLGGFQEKLCVAMPALPQSAESVEEVAHIRAKEVLLPVGNAPSTHILKPENSSAYRGVAESEAWAMTAASYAANAARVALLDIKNAPVTLVVERFDREFAGGQRFAKRLHQEDACQALGLDPHNKYASTGKPKGDDPTYASIAALLRKFSVDPERELSELLCQVIVNLALGNWDAHAKNIALLYREPMTPVLAPLYDVVPIAEVEPRTKFLSMRINGHIRPEHVSAVDVIAEAASWGVPTGEAESILNDVLLRLKDGVYFASGVYPQAGKRHKKAVLGRIAQLSE